MSHFVVRRRRRSSSSGLRWAPYAAAAVTVAMVVLLSLAALEGGPSWNARARVASAWRQAAGWLLMPAAGPVALKYPVWW